MASKEAPLIIWANNNNPKCRQNQFLMILFKSVIYMITIKLLINKCIVYPRSIGSFHRFFFLQTFIREIFTRSTLNLFDGQMNNYADNSDMRFNRCNGSGFVAWHGYSTEIKSTNLFQWYFNDLFLINK